MASNNDPGGKPMSPAQIKFWLWAGKRFLWFTQKWNWVVGTLLLLFALGPFAAPVLANVGASGPATALYTVYSPFCHQFVFRSWMIGGEQVAYPRDRANTDFGSFEEFAANEAFFDNVDITTLEADLVAAARAFRGSETMGYKTAICQRDVAIYLTLALTMLSLAIAQQFGVKVPYLPFWAYVLIAIAPIGLDGFSQLFANPPFNGFGLPFYPIRESTPFLRTLTGALFGFGNAWLAYPYLRDSMDESEEIIRNSLTEAGIIAPKAT